ncbi:MAG: hypothetical protein K0R15_2976 [Clostridiales bacterium]|jgi:signal transduction histidine kinase|nr:hypothetical protein [Clostridiales bacterium]
MWFDILMGIITIISLSILILYKRQVQSICRQLKFIEKHDTNKIISTEINPKEIRELSECLNGILKKQKLQEIDYKRKDNQLKETITNISHDIRTPLTSLKGYFELLADCSDELDRKRYTQIIDTRLNSLHEMVEQLFTYVRLQNESYKLVFEECNINKILYSTIFSYYEDFNNREMEPKITIPDETCLIWANEAALRRVMQNVIKNALDYGRNLIIIEMNSNENSVEILVKNKYNSNDNIDTERVFNRFYKADASRNYNSTGLGLSIAYELIKCMNGVITAFLEDDFFAIKIELGI